MQENAQEVKEESTVTFDDLGLNRDVLNAVKAAGFIKPSPIQEQAIPVVLAGRDMVGQAHTGTGKTAAFGLPALSNMKRNNGVEILVITPTRELATQVSDELFKYGRNLGVRTVTVYGGSSYKRQLDLIGRGASVVVATPGRMLDILKKGMLNDFAPSMVVLDEADEMLSMGFKEDLETIIHATSKKKQILLFSATMTPKVVAVTKKYMRIGIDCF